MDRYFSPINYNDEGNYYPSPSPADFTNINAGRDSNSPAFPFLESDTPQNMPPIPIAPSGSRSRPRNRRSRPTSSQAETGSSTVVEIKDRHTSDVWAHFDKVYETENGVQVKKARCKYCGNIYKADSGNGTSTLKRHANKHINQHGNRESNQTQITNMGTNWRYNSDVYREQLALYIAATDQPINMAEDKYFERFVQNSFFPGFKSYSKTSSRNDLIKLFKKMKLELKNKIHTCHVSVALTADIWSGRAKQDYICVTSHYFDNECKLNKSLLGFRLMDVDHSGEQIYNKIVEVLEDYDIVNKVISLTLDNASSNSKAIDYFQNNYPLYNNLKFFHQRCVCHVINLIVKCGMKTIKENINRIRDCLAWITSSNKRNAEFQDACVKSNMSPRIFALDMPVRWNSTYLMLDSCLPYANIISYFVANNRGPHYLVENDWQIAKVFHSFLKTFYQSTLQLSGVYYPTSPLVIHTIIKISELFIKNKDNEILNAPIKAMQNFFLKYWKPIPFLYCLGAIFDPRIKLAGLENGFDNLCENLQTEVYANQIGEVKNRLFEVYFQYENRYGNP